MNIEISALKQHPQNHKIYGDEDVQELANQISISGWIKPLVITKDNVVVSGHRRLKAAKLLGFDVVPCEVHEFMSETDVLERLLLENESRTKTNAQRAREFKMWEVVEKARAKERQGQRNDLNIVGNCPPSDETGKSRELAAQKAGFSSGRTAKRANTVVNKIEAFRDNGMEKEADILEVALEKSIAGALNLSKTDISSLDESIIGEIKSGKMAVSKAALLTDLNDVENLTSKEIRMKKAEEGLRVLQKLEKKRRQSDKINHEIVQLEILLEKKLNCYKITENCYLIGEGSLPKIYNTLMQNLNLK